MLDFEARVTGHLQCVAKTANLFVIGCDGKVTARLKVAVSPPQLAEVRQAMNCLGVLP